MTDATIRLTFPAKPDYLLLARLALSGVARTLPVGDELLADLKLAVTEACGNAIRHAYDDDGGPVMVAFLVSDGRLEVVVEDEGGGIMLTEPIEDELQEPLGGPHGPLESGMGMPIIRAIVDELEVGARSGGPGTSVRMVKLLGQPTGD